MRAIEMVRFRVEADANFFAARAAAMAALSETCPGLVSERLILLENGLCVDEIVWESQEEAQAAGEMAPSIPFCAQYFGLMDEVVSLEHGTLRQD